MEAAVRGGAGGEVARAAGRVRRGGGGGRCRCVRQRENALLYVRGLVEHGGRKSLQPTLFRLGETPARYESVQQFLADSPWDPALLVRACAERVAPRDRRAGLGRRRHRDRQGRQALAGGEAAVLGHAGQDRQLPDHVSRARGRRSGGRCRSAGALYLPEEWCDDLRAAAEGEDPRRGRASRRSRSSPLACRAGGRLGGPAGADPRRLAPTATTPPSAPSLARARARVRASRSRPQTSVYGPETIFAVPERNGTVGRPRTVARPDRKPSRCARSPSGCRRGLEDAALPDDTGGRGRPSRFAFVRVVATHPVRTDTCRRAEEWLIIEWPAGADAPSDYWLSNLPRRRAARAARPARPAALDDRARLPPAQRRARTRPLRRQKLPRLPPPLRARHLRPRLPHPRTARPKSPAAGLTLPQTVLLLQPVLRCWAGRCRTCQQPVDLDQLALFHQT